MNKYTKNLTAAFDYLHDCGMDALVSICKNDPRLGEDNHSREVNSWLTIMSFLLERYLDGGEDTYFESEFEKCFWSVPIKYRDAVYSAINEIAEEMNICIGLDVSNCKANEDHVVEHVDPSDVKIVLRRTQVLLSIG